MYALKSLISQVLSNTSIKVFFGTKTWGGGGGPRYGPTCSPYSAAYGLAPLKKINLCLFYVGDHARTDNQITYLIILNALEMFFFRMDIFIAYNPKRCLKE